MRPDLWQSGSPTPRLKTKGPARTAKDSAWLNAKARRVPGIGWIWVYFYCSELGGVTMPSF